MLMQLKIADQEFMLEQKSSNTRPRRRFSREYLEWYYRYTRNWFHCNAFCKSFIVFDLVVFTSHMILNIFPLRAWAQGNLFLIMYTYYAFYMSLFCLMLLTGNPAYMMAPEGTRRFIFILSIMMSSPLSTVTSRP